MLIAHQDDAIEHKCILFFGVGKNSGLWKHFIINSLSYRNVIGEIYIQLYQIFIEKFNKAMSICNVARSGSLSSVSVLIKM